MDPTPKASPVSPGAGFGAAADEAPLELDLENALESPSAPVPASTGIELDLDAPVVEAKLDLAPPPTANARSESAIERDMGGKIELDLGGGGAVPRRPPPVTGPAGLKAALERGDDARAYELFFAGVADGYPPLEPHLNLRLAAVLERANALGEAIRACQRAAEADMRGPVAPRAIFMAARILGERAGDPEGARAMYTFLVKNFPSNELAARARDALARL